MLIASAEKAVKTNPEKLKNLGHQMTVTRTPAAVIKPNIRTPTAPWLDRPGHLLAHGKNASSPLTMEVPEQFKDEQVFQNHRIPAMPPIQIATLSGLNGACSEGS
jgi:hypothetical protein